MIGTGLAIAGALLGAFGAHEQAKAQEHATDAAANAAQYNPYDINSPLGSLDFNRATNSVNAGLTPQQQAIYNTLNGIAQSRLQGSSPTSGFQSFANNVGTNVLPGLFNGALSASNNLPIGAYTAYSGLLNQLTGGALGGANNLFSQAGVSPNAGLASLLNNSGLGGATSALSGLNSASYNPSAANGLIAQSLGSLGLNGANGLIGQSLGALDTSQFQNLLGQAGNSLNLTQARDLLGQSQSALNPSVGNSFLNQASQAAQVNYDPTQMVNDRLSLLRQQAAPQEEQQFNALQQRLFNQGRLGSTGGGQEIEAFARGLGQADLGRQVEAQNLGLAATQQAANIGLNQAGLFSNLAGQSFGNNANTANILQGLAGTSAGFGLNSAGLLSQLAGQSLSGTLGLSNAYQGLAGLSGNLDLSRAGQIAQLAGMSGDIAGNAANFDLSRLGQMGSLGQALLSQGQGYTGLDVNRSLGLLGLTPSLLGLAGQFGGNQFGAASTISDLINARAQQRLANAQSLFGFGNDLGLQDYNQGLSALQGQQSIENSLRNLIALGGNIGGQQAAAGGNVAQALLSNNESPLGGFLGGLATSLIGSSLKNPSSAPSMNSLIYG